MHALRYATKYPQAGFPDWVLHTTRRIRWMGASKPVGPLVSDREATVKDATTEDAKESLPREHRSLATRMADSQQQINFFSQSHDGKRRFFGRLPREVVDAALNKGNLATY